MKLERKWIIVVVLVGVVAILFVFSRNYKKVADVADKPSDLTIEQKILEEGVSVSRGAVVTSGTATQTVKYTQLMKDYEGRRIQFDMTCQAIPPNTTYKNNTKIMFDNRSGDARVITIGGVQYNFPGYGYKILNISGAKLPARVSFNCGAAVNVGGILIQN